MLAEWVVRLGPWSWLVFGVILLGLEILVPGVFLVWVGIAAIIVGANSLMLWETAWWVWELQILSFAAISVITVLIGRRYVLRSGHISDQPHLNQRGQSLIGRTAILREPINEGRGRLHIDDTIWIVEGPDMPEGQRARIISSHGRVLRVEKADQNP